MDQAETSHTLGNLADPNGHYFTIFAVIIRPKSRGSVTCKTSDVFDDPLIDQGYLTDPEGYDKKVSARSRTGLITGTTRRSQVHPPDGQDPAFVQLPD